MFIHWGVYAVAAGEYKGNKVNGLGEWIMKEGNYVEDWSLDFAENEVDRAVRLSSEKKIDAVVISSYDGMTRGAINALKRYNK